MCRTCLAFELQPPPTCLPELRRALLDEWCNIPQVCCAVSTHFVEITLVLKGLQRRKLAVMIRKALFWYKRFQESVPGQIQHFHSHSAVNCFFVGAMQTMFSFLLLCIVAGATVPEAMRSFLFPGNVNNEDRPTVLQSREEEVAVAEDPLSRLQSSIEEAQRNYDQGDVSRYMLSQPIQQAQCHVEIQVTHRQPGRCIRLGGQMPACQSNDYVYINYKECS
ncbi:uncharacterized protein TNCV_3604981 [Trichonephila clavipes]|nr:uncharacterized protein TNCV_3604981 [Trichonephila clavipes]